MKSLITLLAITTTLCANTLDTLKENGLIKDGAPIKLHLGCGGCAKEGHINIDFPPSEHTVLTNFKADYFQDITTLSFPENSVKKICNYHVFEHFDRATALALLTKWQTWLENGGTLEIETPDFKTAIERFLSEKDSSRQNLILRHIFGSHEEHWAVHWDGWFEEKFTAILPLFGFEVKEVKKYQSLRDVDNIVIKAKKVKNLTNNVIRKSCKKLLRESLTDVDAENPMLDCWMKIYDEKITNML